MKAVMRFVRTTLLGGFFFLIPLVLALVVLGHALKFAAKLLVPLANLLPGWTLVGVEMPMLVAVLFLVLVAFGAGLVARSGPGSRMGGFMEGLLMRVKPGYRILRAMTASDADQRMEVALVEIDDVWVFAFVMDRHPDGVVTVFLPDAPNPVSGSVGCLRAEQLRVLDMPIAKAVRIIRQVGVDSAPLVEAARKAGIAFEKPAHGG